MHLHNNIILYYIKFIIEINKNTIYLETHNNKSFIIRHYLMHK